MIWGRLWPLRCTVSTMNSPTPNLISKIVAPTPMQMQTLSTVDERNPAISTVNLPPPSTTLSLSAGTSNTPTEIISGTAEVQSSPAYVDPSIATADLGVSNAQSSINTPLSLTNDSKALDSVLGASQSSISSTSLLESDLVDPDIGRILVTAEELGIVGKLSDWLEERLGPGVVCQWGTVPGSKTLANLWSELVEGESSLEDGKPPTRTVNVVCVKIKNNAGESLEETYQEMSDGSRRGRNRPLSEKMKLGEDVRDACARGIAEELGTDLVGQFDLMQETYAKKEEERDSISYPGLPTRFVIHSMEARIQHVLPTEFSTGENELCHEAGSGVLYDAEQPKLLTVARHFWRWIPDTDSCDVST